jgi:hypothetical protein
MCSLAASDSALKAAGAMTDPTISHPSGIAARRRPGQPPDAIRSALCLYCRTERFVYWPPGIRLSLADCPGCQRPEPAGRDIAPLDGRPAAERTRTTARELPEPVPGQLRAAFSLLAERAGG